MKTIVLTGLSGSGKTTVAKLLGKMLNVTVLDTDSEIEKSENLSVTEIFAQKGEKYFRQLEKNIIINSVKTEDMVVSLGGGAFEDNQTRDFLLKNCRVIYLKTSPATVFSRLKGDNTRPLLSSDMSVEKISKMLKLREYNYKLAHETVDTEGKTPDKTAMEIQNNG